MCLNPTRIKIKRNEKNFKEYKKLAKKEKFEENGIMGTGCIIAPCGFCSECRMTNAKFWEKRIAHEIAEENYKFAGMVTLTYNNINVPERNTNTMSIVLKDIQDFIKRMRKKGFECKYIARGEYGLLKGRPHGHLILLIKNGLPKEVLKDKRHKELEKFQKDHGNKKTKEFMMKMTNKDFTSDLFGYETSKKGKAFWNSKTILRTWGKGRTSISELNSESLKYCIGYGFKANNFRRIDNKKEIIKKIENGEIDLTKFEKEITKGLGDNDIARTKNIIKNFKNLQMNDKIKLIKGQIFRENRFCEFNTFSKGIGVKGFYELLNNIIEYGKEEDIIKYFQHGTKYYIKKTIEMALSIRKENKEWLSPKFKWDKKFGFTKGKKGLEHCELPFFKERVAKVKNTTILIKKFTEMSKKEFNNKKEKTKNEFKKLKYHFDKEFERGNIIPSEIKIKNIELFIREKLNQMVTDGEIRQLAWQAGKKEYAMNRSF